VAEEGRKGAKGAKRTPVEFLGSLGVPFAPLCAQLLVFGYAEREIMPLMAAVAKA
jgi:hypothetical protein